MKGTVIECSSPLELGPSRGGSRRAEGSLPVGSRRIVARTRKPLIPKGCLVVGNEPPDRQELASYLNVNTFETVLKLDPGRVSSKAGGDWECKQTQGKIPEKHEPVLWEVRHLNVRPGRQQIHDALKIA